MTLINLIVKLFDFKINITFINIFPYKYFKFSHNLTALDRHCLMSFNKQSDSEEESGGSDFVPEESSDESGVSVEEQNEQNEKFDAIVVNDIWKKMTNTEKKKKPETIEKEKTNEENWWEDGYNLENDLKKQEMDKIDQIIRVKNLIIIA